MAHHPAMARRRVYIYEQLVHRLHRLDTPVTVADVSPEQWAVAPIPRLDELSGWTSPRPGGGMVEVCVHRIAEVTAHLHDVQPNPDPDRYVYIDNGDGLLLVSSIDNFVRILADLTEGEILAMLDEPDPRLRRERAEHELADRHPQALRLLSDVQTRALGT